MPTLIIPIRAQHPQAQRLISATHLALAIDKTLTNIIINAQQTLGNTEQPAIKLSCDLSALQGEIEGNLLYLQGTKYTGINLTNGLLLPHELDYNDVSYTPNDTHLKITSSGMQIYGWIENQDLNIQSENISISTLEKAIFRI